MTEFLGNNEKVFERPEHDLSIISENGSFIISQEGRQYKSRRPLSHKLLEIIDLAIDAGLTSLWRNQHPTPRFFKGGEEFRKGSPHIGFSRKTSERWVFVVDERSGREIPDKVTIQFAYHKLVEKLGIPKEWEGGGGQNYMIDVDYLPTFLNRLDSKIIDAVEATLNQECPPDSHYDTIGIVKEKPQLQDILISQHNKIFGPGFSYLGQEKQLPSGRLDIILADNMDQNKKYVLELKHRRVRKKDINQIDGYLGDLRKSSSEEEYVGILVAKEIQQDALAVGRSDLSFYEYDDLMELKLIHKGGPEIFF